MLRRSGDETAAGPVYSRFMDQNQPPSPATPVALDTRMFGVAPHKQREGYANFAIEDPPLKLVLFQNPGAAERLNHLGIEAPTSQQVTAALTRFTEAGLETRVTEQDVCCHAAQHKVFVTAPNVPLGWWEYYTVLDDSPANPGGASTSVCEAAGCSTGDSEQATCCA